MGLSSVSSFGDNATAPQPVRTASIFERQIAALQKQITTIKESKMDAKEKTERIKELESQIMELQNQMNMEQLQEKTRELEAAQRKQAQKLQQEQQQQKADLLPEQVDAVHFSLQAQNLLRADQQYGEAVILRQTQSKLPTRAEREEFAPKIAAKAYSTWKNLSEASVEAEETKKASKSKKSSENGQISDKDATASQVLRPEDAQVDDKELADNNKGHKQSLDVRL